MVRKSIVNEESLQPMLGKLYFYNGNDIGKASPAEKEGRKTVAEQLSKQSTNEQPKQNSSR